MSGGSRPEIDGDLRVALRSAFIAADPLAALYLDRAKMRVVKVRAGICSDPELTAEDVDDDEDRFLEVPVLRPSEDYVWMTEFVEDEDDERISRLLDGKKGANERFVKRLPEAGPEAVAAWKAFREARIDEQVDVWLDEVL